VNAQAEEAKAPVEPAPADASAKPASEKLPLRVAVHGFARAGYAYVPYDPKVSIYVGRDSGFRLYNSRLIVNGGYGERVDFELSVDGSTSIDDAGRASFRVGFVDAYTTVKWSWGYVRAGQFKTPFNGEFLLDDQYVPFARRSPVSDGLLRDEAGRDDVRGISLDRQLGAMVGINLPVGAKWKFRADLAGVNGNGSNQARNDNRTPAVVGRVSFGIPALTIGASGFWNDRTTDIAANEATYRDIAGEADVLADIKGFKLGSTPAALHLFGMAVYRSSQLQVGKNEALGSSQQGQLPSSIPAIHSLGVVASAGLLLEGTTLNYEPALRFSHYRPDDSVRAGETVFALNDVTVGVNLMARSLPMRLQLNYTQRMADAAFNQPKFVAETVLQANF
jgi:hypothetical protein